MLDAQTIATVKATIPLLVETGPKLTAITLVTHVKNFFEFWVMRDRKSVV